MRTLCSAFGVSMDSLQLHLWAVWPWPRSLPLLNVSSPKQQNGINNCTYPITVVRLYWDAYVGRVTRAWPRAVHPCTNYHFIMIVDMIFRSPGVNELGCIKKCIHLCRVVGSLREEKLVIWLCGTALPDGHVKSLLGWDASVGLCMALW